MISHKPSKQELNLQYLIPLAECPRNSTYNTQQLPQNSTKKCYRDFQKELKKKNRSKSKKHHKHKSPSVDKKFSDDEQPSKSTATSFQASSENKKEAKKEEKSAEIKKASTFNDLAYFPQGSILSIKSCSLQILTKKSGKVDMGIEILSQQSHKALISELFDPGFSVLSVKKDKNQTQIIQYLKSTTKAYRFVLCWLEALEPSNNDILRKIVDEANERKRIMGWHNDHIKIHIMSFRQLAMIEKFSIPTRFSTQAAAKSFKEERLALIIQYPQRIFEIKELYRPFASISRKKESFEAEQADVKSEIEKKQEDTPKQQVNEQKRQWYQNIKVVYEGWGNDQNPKENTPNEAPQASHNEENQQISLAPAQAPPKTGNNIPEYVEKIRLHFGFKLFEPILSDESSEEEEKPQPRDLATDLLNELLEYDRRTASSPTPHPKEVPYQYSPYHYYYDPQQAHYYQTPIDAQWSNSNYNEHPHYQSYSPKGGYPNRFDHQYRGVIKQNYLNPSSEGQQYVPSHDPYPNQRQQAPDYYKEYKHGQYSYQSYQH